MSENESHEELHEIDPLEETAPAAPQAPQVDYQEALYQRSIAGMSPPFFNPRASKDYYRFLFAGLLIVLGCLMPFDHNWLHVGYKTFFGGLWMIIGLGLLWSAWGAINLGVFKMKWVLLAFFPFAWGLVYLIFYAKFPGVDLASVPVPTVEQFPELKTQALIDAKHYALAAEANPAVNNWSELVNKLFDKHDSERFSKVAEALQWIGPGKIFVFLGAFLAELSFILGIFAGAKKLKQQRTGPVRRTR